MGQDPECKKNGARFCGKLSDQVTASPAGTARRSRGRPTCARVPERLVVGTEKGNGAISTVALFIFPKLALCRVSKSVKLVVNICFGGVTGSSLGFLADAEFLQVDCLCQLVAFTARPGLLDAQFIELFAEPFRPESLTGIHALQQAKQYQ